MLLHPLVWSNTAIVSPLGPSQLCPLLAGCHSTCTGSLACRPAQVGRQLARRSEASANYAEPQPPPSHISLHGKRTRTVQISRSHLTGHFKLKMLASINLY